MPRLIVPMQTAASPLQAALSQLNDVSVIWQLGLAAASLALAWLFTYALRRRFADQQRPLGLKLDGLSQVMLPLIVVLLLLLSKTVLQHWMPTDLIHLFLSLALALTLIRAAKHMLHRAFAPSELLLLVEQALAGVVLIGVVLHLTGLHREVLQTLDDIGLSIGKQRISLLLVLEGVISILLTVVIALWIGRLIEARVMRADTLELNLRIVLAKIVRALLMLVGVLIALPLAGIDVTFLSVFGGALGVGLGFGLQKVASNYISGFIILLDRSVRIGDVVTVDNKYGEITQITNRYTVVKSLDGTEAIVPNETMITSTVVNHSFTTRDVRMNLQLSVSYTSPLERAMAIMKNTALANPRVLHQPQPEVLLKEFGDNGLLLELVIWIDDPEDGQLNLRSALNLAIWREFQAAGIEIPFPRRDIRVIDSASAAAISSPAAP